MQKCSRANATRSLHGIALLQRAQAHCKERIALQMREHSALNAMRPRPNAMIAQGQMQ